MDAIFGVTSYRNEITWKRTPTVKGNFGQGSKLWGQATDTLLYYTKTNDYVFNQPFGPYSQEYIDKAYRHVEPETGRRYRLVSMIGPGGAAKGNPQYELMGVTRYWRYSKVRMQELIDQGLIVQSKPGTVPNRKYYLDEGRGVPVQSLWDDIGNLQASAAERLGYPTQKPQALLERIIEASSNEGDVVFDPFCGCGTAVAAAREAQAPMDRRRRYPPRRRSYEEPSQDRLQHRPRKGLRGSRRARRCRERSRPRRAGPLPVRVLGLCPS